MKYSVKLPNDYCVMSKKGWMSVKDLKPVDHVVTGFNILSTIINVVELVETTQETKEELYHLSTELGGEHLLSFKNPLIDPTGVTTIHQISLSEITTIRNTPIRKIFREIVCYMHEHAPSRVDELESVIAGLLTINTYMTERLKTQGDFQQLTPTLNHPIRLTLDTTTINTNKPYILTMFMNTIAVMDLRTLTTIAE